MMVTRILTPTNLDRIGSGRDLCVASAAAYQ